MCGSGTIPVEATLMAINKPPGIFRKHFAFEKWKDFDPVMWSSVKSQSENMRTPFHNAVIGSDISAQMISIARANTVNAGLEHVIGYKQGDFEAFVKPCETGMIITNPPYGERIRVNDIIDLYKRFGDTLKKSYSGFSAWVISADKNALKFIGLKPSKKYTVFNGPLECFFAKFDIYKGSKKVNNQRNDENK
jgi:putative N6-adenine-specific DNA methylase